MKILAASKHCELIGLDTPISDLFRKAVDEWDCIRGADDLPVWKIDHLMGFPPRLVPYANVLRWDEQEEDYLFLYWGSGRTEMMKHDYTAEFLSALKPEVYADLVRSELDDVRRNCQPMISNAQVRLTDGTTTQVDKVRLPFLDANGDVRIVLSLDDVEQFLNRYYLTWVRPENKEKAEA